MLWKLLRQHISTVQLAGFALANLVGLTIVMLAIQIAADVRPLMSDEDSFVRKDYLVITRNVTTAGAMRGNVGEFSEADIADLTAQPWCRRVGRFTSCEFSIDATIGVGDDGRAMRSQIFFESIPDEFIDVDPGQWGFDPARPEIPVIVARDYLSLYNFGFAATQGLPRISEGQVGMIPIQFTLGGNGERQSIPGRIVGFSGRLNTIIVPEEFMRWANERFGEGNTRAPLRLIVEVSKPGDVAIEKYMDQHRYDVAGDKMNNSKANYFLTVATSIVVAVGIVISLLAFFVLMLSIYLLLQKNTRKLRDLLLLGYSPAEVARPYKLLVLAINGAVFVLAFVLMLIARGYYLPTLKALGLASAPVFWSLLIGLGIMAAITVGNIIAISRKVNALWRE